MAYLLEQVVPVSIIYIWHNTDIAVYGPGRIDSYNIPTRVLEYNMCTRASSTGSHAMAILSSE